MFWLLIFSTRSFHQIAVGCERGRVLIWDVGSQSAAQLRAILDAPTEDRLTPSIRPLTSVCFSNDGSLLLAVSPLYGLVGWRISSAQVEIRVNSLPGPDRLVLAPDRLHIAIGSSWNRLA